MAERELGGRDCVLLRNRFEGAGVPNLYIPLVDQPGSNWALASDYTIGLQNLPLKPFQPADLACFPMDSTLSPSS